jgi:hypothetical protein
MNTKRENVIEVLEVQDNSFSFGHNYHIFICQFVETRKNELDNLKIIDLQWQIQFFFSSFNFFPTLWTALFVAPWI